MVHETRESWLLALAHVLRPMFAAVDQVLHDKLRLACGWPSSGGLGRKRATVGECFTAEASADGTCEVFISPRLAEPLKVAEVVVHELVHAVLPRHVKHGPPFVKLARRVGLVGPPHATLAGPPLAAVLADLMVPFGPYPHAEVRPLPKVSTSCPPHKIVCPGCGYTVRAATRWVEMGLPRCPCGQGMLLDDETEEKIAERKGAAQLLLFAPRREPTR